MMIKNCPDCGVAPGHIHNPGCDQERCTVCGRQYLICECKGHDHNLAIWKPIVLTLTLEQAEKLEDVLIGCWDEGPLTEGWKSPGLMGLVGLISETIETYKYANKCMNVTPEGGTKNQL